MTTLPAPLLDITGFDRTAALSQSERDALTSLGWQLRRRRSHDAELPEWDVIARLLAPLDAARSALRHLLRYPTPPPISQGRDRAGVVPVRGRGNRVLGLVGRCLGEADRRRPPCLRPALAGLGGSDRSS